MRVILSIILSIAVLTGIIFGVIYFSDQENTTFNKIEFVKLDAMIDGEANNLLFNPNLVIIRSNTELKQYNLSESLNLEDSFFDNNIIILASMGKKSNGGYKIEIMEIDEYKDKIVVQVQATSPSEDCLTSQVITYPVEIVKIKATKKEILFNTREITSTCQR